VKKRIIIADDHDLILDGISNLLKDLTDIEIVATAKTGHELLEKTKKILPDMVISDIEMPELSGIEAIKIIKDLYPKIKTVILEADLGLCNEKESEMIAAKFLPYIHHSEIIKNHFSGQEDFKELYYIPFYRYIDFDALIGFREMYNTATSKPTNILDNLGYHPLHHKPKNMKNDIRALKPIRNKYYEEIKQICKQKNYKLITVMTPMCTNVKGLNYFEKANKIYPEIHNLENVVEGDQYFSSCGHMNDAGARLFTSIVINRFFLKIISNSGLNI